MKCVACQQASIVMRPTWKGLEISCPGCGRVYSPEEIKELVGKLRRLRQQGAPSVCPAD